MQSAAPVILFAYARPLHLQAALESLRRNELASQTHLTVYCDGPKNAGSAAGVRAVRELIAQTRDGFASVTRVYRDENMGLARSVIAGVSQALERNERVIVLEDDLVLSPHFLRYMNDALNCYAADEEVASIHGYCYPVAKVLPETFFLRGADCWGWATWRRAWKTFDPNGQKLLMELQQKKLVEAFDLDGAYSFSRMLKNQIQGLNDSWAVRWHASCFVRGMLTLYPGRSLVQNIGTDASGTHKDDTHDFHVETASTPVLVSRLPLFESPVARAAFIDFLSNSAGGGWRHWASNIVGRLRRFRCNR